MIIAGLVLAAGCGDDDDGEPSMTPTIADTTTPGATTDIDPETGLPRSFPDDFPVLEGTTVTRASEYTDRYVIEWRSEESVEEAAGYYADSLDSAPWSIEATRAEDNATVFDFAGGSTAEYSGALAVANVDGGSRILLNLIIE
jgi:hypothetical protein